MQTLKEIIIATIQIAILLAAFPAWLCVGALLHLTRRDYIRTPERDEDRTVYGYPMGIFGNIGYRCLNVNFFGE